MFTHFLASTLFIRFVLCPIASLNAMILDEAFYRAFDDSGDSKLMARGHLSEDGFKMGGHTTHTSHTAKRGVVAEDIVAEEILKVVCHKLTDARIIDVADNERSYGSQIPVGHRLLINTADNILISLLRLCQECVLYGGRQPTFENAIEETPPQRSTAPLITKDIAQRGDVLRDARSIVKTTVRPRPQYAGYARIVPQHGAGCSQQVAVGTHFRLGKHLRKQRGHLWRNRRRAARPIEVYARHFFSSHPRRSNLREQLFLQNRDDLRRTLMKEIDALRVESQRL